jgi:alpha-tubulin suppressor-like RCC1 family protein
MAAARTLRILGFIALVAVVTGIVLSPDGDAALAGTGSSVPGDVDCSGTANSIDAVLLLQFSAELLSTLGCSQNADVSDYGGRISAIDAALILQYSAGLLDHLGPPVGPTPTPKPPRAVTALTAGTSFTCALTASADVRCWGDNISHSLGVQRTCFPLVYYGVACSTLPVELQGLTDVTALSAGMGIFYDGHVCALTSGGGVKCWGYNYWGELGDGTATDSKTPVDVLGFTDGVVAIATGGYHSCALVDDGDPTTIGYGAKCWGENVFGQLGIGSTNAGYTSPVDAQGLATGVFAIAGGLYHTCALVDDGDPATSGYRVKCWGYNNFGKLGNGIESESNVPVDVAWDNAWGGVVAIAAGGRFTCALTTSGGVKCWGENQRGELGNGTTTDSATPVDVIGLESGVVGITAGGYHACAVTTGGGLKCWGQNARGQLGNGTTTDSAAPVDVIGLTSGVAGVDAGFLYTCAWTDEGKAKCWGRNLEGQLGDGTTTDRSTPVDVVGLNGGAGTGP